MEEFLSNKENNMVDSPATSSSVSKGKTFDSGHFADHNRKIVQKLHDMTSLHDAVKAYGLQIADDAIVLWKAGASEEQILSSRKALDDQFETAWAAMTANTKQEGVK